ncbi:MAG: TolC family protein [Bacteroidales bacterium]|nr:TolC family protein [Bacteroidales bacterium]
MTLQQAIDKARINSVPALEARATFVSDYWAWRSYQSSRLPTLSLYGTLGGFDRSLRLLQNYETGEMVYTSNYNMENSLGLRARQNITFTGGTLSLYTDLTRIDQFSSGGKTWYAQPVILSYSQPLFSFNQFKWDKLISPKEYEKAKRTYLESMEEVTCKTVERYFGVMEAQKIYDVSLSNFHNTARMLRIARERLSLGSITKDEYLQLELRMLSDSISINENHVAISEAQMQLNSLLGLDETVEVRTILEEDLPTVLLDYDFVLQKYSENNSFSLANDINILNAEAEIARANAQRGIAMQLNASFGLSKTAPEFHGVYRRLLNQEVVGLTFTVPILDWGEGKGRVKKAEAAAEVVRARVAQSENDMRISVFTAVGQFNNQRQLCDVSRRASVIAQERFELVMEKFQNGTMSVTDLNTARSESDEATRKYIRDISSFWSYYYTLRKLTLYDFLKGKDLSIDYEELMQ